MTKSKIFFILALGFISGVFVASFFQIESYIILSVVVGGAIILIVNYKNKKIAVISLGFLFLALGIWVFNGSRDRAGHEITRVWEGPVTFGGVIAAEPEIGEGTQKILVENENREKILVSTSEYSEYSFGDQLKISCAVKKAENFSSGFNYQMHLAKDKIYRVCSRPQITLLARNQGRSGVQFLLGVKNSFEEKLSQIFPDPEGAFLKGLLLGGSKRMTKNLSDAFSRTGTSHTVAVSGFNVTVVAIFLMWAGIWIGLWRQQAFWFSIVGIALFILMTGFPASAVRAGIMGSLVLWAMKEGRLGNSTNAIMLAAALMLAANPLLLRFDAGFQLSFLATLGIIHLAPLLENFFWQGRAPKLVKETVFLTLAATIFVLPVIIANFEKFSLVSPIANFLILPAIPGIMLAGFAAGTAGFVFLPLGQLMGFIPYIFLKIELAAIQWMASWSWSAIEIKNFGWAYFAAYYIILASSLYYFKRKNRAELFLTDN